ncbi:MAG: transglycosylase SLT domain-containing protein [Deltaproteobacteria bacterium]|nr:transglycosylase SLT domain-containing protein [Deltaproteobacteria bacterium]MBI3390047.1 transglycosylase SLT domain-containing protein [Deltaproteobacteria bacterium]
MGGVESVDKKKRPMRRRRRRRRRSGWQSLLRNVLEAVALLAAGLIGVITAVGRAADRFTGSGVWTHLLPFAGAVLLLAVGTAVVLGVWLVVRAWLARWFTPAPLILAFAIAGGAGWFATLPVFDLELVHLRTLIGGSADAERRAIAHQVFAAYRRGDRVEVQRMLERARGYEGIIHAAAEAFGLDPEVLIGLAATESSFEPRDSADGGRGLLQITAVPEDATRDVQHRLGVAQVDLRDARQNAWLAAATMRRYLDDMQGDLFLGLLAYNIGPHNGGLRAIMEQYGARDFVTIQPYLQHLPRDYPVRVLANALAARVWRREGRLPAYEEGNNAARIQRLGIPGLESIAVTDH